MVCTRTLNRSRVRVCRSRVDLTSTLSLWASRLRPGMTTELAGCRVVDSPFYFGFFSLFFFIFFLIPSLLVFFFFFFSFSINVWSRSQYLLGIYSAYPTVSLVSLSIFHLSTVLSLCCDLRSSNFFFLAVQPDCHIPFVLMGSLQARVP